MLRGMLPGLRATAFALVTASCTGEAPPAVPTPQAAISTPAPAPPPSMDASEPPPRAVEPITTAGMGFLTLLCAPACDQVVVDGGTNLGASPMYRTPIPVGKHRLTLRVTVPAAVKNVTVDIHEGEATVVRMDMSP